MAALQCEICGGKLMAKSGGLFECEYCGMQYDKTRIQEMVQEIKGTVKVEGTVEVTGTVKVEGNVSVQNFLKRGQMALSDNKRLEADAFFNDALNIDSECAQAYLGKLFCELRVSQIDHLKGRQFPFNTSKNYEKICRFGDAQTKQFLQECNEQAQKVWKANQKRAVLAARMIDLNNATQICACADGTAKVAGSFASKIDTTQWYDIVAVSAGVFHVLGLKTDGTVVAAGSDSSERNQVSQWKNIIAISAAQGHSLGLKSDGTVAVAGHNGCGQCEVSDWNNLIAVSAGQSSSVGLKADGTVVAVGKNDGGMCDVDGWRDIVAISAGSFHTLGLKADGTVVAAGCGLTGKCDVENWRDIIAISAGSSHSVGLKADGTVVAVGSNDGGRCNVYGWRNIVAISAGGQATLGLKEDGSLVIAGGFGTGANTGWKLFNDINTVEQERKDAILKTSIRKKAENDFRNHAEIEDGNLVEYRGKRASVTIPDDVIGVYDGAFLECSALEEIIVSGSHPRFTVKNGCLIDKDTQGIKVAFGNPVIPTDGSVTQICTYAFSNCEQMTSITIPNCVTEICGGAFAGCTALKDIRISNSHPTYRVRNGCIIDIEEAEIVAGFAHSTIPSDGSVTAIGWMAFENCEGLTTIDIPEGIITIGEDAFCGCKNLRSVSLPNGVENIEHQAFFGCESLISIEIPDTVESIDDSRSVFKSCNKLTIYAPHGSYAEQWATRHRIPVKENDRFKRERLEKERISLENELSNLRGLFTGKRRKEIEARLLEIENELKGLK